MTINVDHRTATVNGINIHYVVQGEGAPAILLHGWPEFWYSWREQIPVLSERFQVIVPDMRGFGYSDKPARGYDTRTVVIQMSNDGYAASVSCGATVIACLVLPSSGPVSPMTESPSASAFPSGSITSSPTASSASFSRLRAAFSFLS